MKQLVKLEFSTYFKWEKRTDYHLIRFPGVYAINITEKSNLAGRTLKWADIDYIGVTTVSLRGRLGGFNRAIRKGRGHSGGNTIFADKGHVDTWENLHIYVAMMGIECNAKVPKPDDYRMLGTVTYLEYEAFAQYYEVMKKLPTYNKMKSF